MQSVEECLPLIQPYAGDNGSCSIPVAMRYLNAARSLLWNKTDVAPTTAYIAICCTDFCFTLPSEFKRVILGWIGNRPLSLGNEWYQSIPSVGVLQNRQGSGGWGGNNGSWGKFGGDKMVQVGGTHVTFQNYDAANYQWALQAEDNKDIGIEITVQAVNKYSTKNSETVALVAPPEYALSTELYKGIISITKPRTAGRVRLYAIDPNTQKRLLMAIYQPYDTNPTFYRYKVLGAKECLTLYCKKKYFDVVAPTDLVEYTSEALIHAVSAIVNRENKGADAITAYSQNLQLALAEVNRETADIEEDVGSPMRVFYPDNPDSISPGRFMGDYGSGYGYYGITQ